MNAEPTRVLVRTDDYPAVYDAVDMNKVLDRVEAEIAGNEATPDEVEDLALRLRLEAGHANPPPIIVDPGGALWK